MSASAAPAVQADLPLAANPSPEKIGLFCCLYAVSPNLLGIGQVVMQASFGLCFEAVPTDLARLDPQCFSRFQTRERYAIRGSPVEDVLIGESYLYCYVELLAGSCDP